MSNLIWKEKKKNENRKKQKEKKATGQWRWNRKKKKRRETWTLLNTAYEKKKKERTNIFLNRQYIDWKKEEKKTEHFWTVIVILFWLVVKWNFLSLFEFKGDNRKIFFPVRMKFDENH